MQSPTRSLKDEPLREENANDRRVGYKRHIDEQNPQLIRHSPETIPTWAKLVRTLAVEFDQDGAFLVG